MTLYSPFSMTEVCKLGNYYAEEDLPGVSDEALQVMLDNANANKDLYTDLVVITTDEYLRKMFRSSI